MYCVYEVICLVNSIKKSKFWQSIFVLQMSCMKENVENDIEICVVQLA